MDGLTEMVKESIQARVWKEQLAMGFDVGFVWNRTFHDFECPCCKEEVDEGQWSENGVGDEHLLQGVGGGDDHDGGGG